jgi:hypothetical protein
VSNYAEAGPSAGKSADDPIRNSPIGGGYLPFAEPDHENSSQHECENRADRYGDYHNSMTATVKLNHSAHRPGSVLSMIAPLARMSESYLDSSIRLLEDERRG